MAFIQTISFICYFSHSKEWNVFLLISRATEMHACMRNCIFLSRNSNFQFFFSFFRFFLIEIFCSFICFFSCVLINMRPWSYFSLTVCCFFNKALWKGWQFSISNYNKIIWYTTWQQIQMCFVIIQASTKIKIKRKKKMQKSILAIRLSCI